MSVYNRTTKSKLAPKTFTQFRGHLHPLPRLYIRKDNPVPPQPSLEFRIGNPLDARPRNSRDHFGNVPKQGWHGAPSHRLYSTKNQQLTHLRVRFTPPRCHNPLGRTPMPLQQKIEANRPNALKSTGPRPPNGKSVCATDASRYRRLAETVLLACEDRAHSTVPSPDTPQPDPAPEPHPDRSSRTCRNAIASPELAKARVLPILARDAARYHREFHRAIAAHKRSQSSVIVPNPNPLPPALAHLAPKWLRPRPTDPTPRP